MDERRALIEIDLNPVGSAEELQSLLATALNFPGFYGRNWNAFEDAITGLVEMPRKLRLIGWTCFANRLPREAESLREGLLSATLDPQIATIVEYA